MYFLVKIQLGHEQHNKYNEDRNKPKYICSQQGGQWRIHLVLYLGDAEHTYKLLATDQLCVYTYRYVHVSACV